jgi:hypothetical protein
LEGVFEIGFSDVTNREREKDVELLWFYGFQSSYCGRIGAGSAVKVGVGD